MKLKRKNFVEKLEQIKNKNKGIINIFNKGIIKIGNSLIITLVWMHEIFTTFNRLLIKSKNLIFIHCGILISQVILKY